MVAIRISPTTPGIVLISETFLRISSVPIRMLFRDAAKHMLVVNAAVKMLLENVVTAAHTGDVSVVEGVIYHKMILIGMTPAVADVVADDTVIIMMIALEEERIES